MEFEINQRGLSIRLQVGFWIVSGLFILALSLWGLVGGDGVFGWGLAVGILCVGLGLATWLASNPIHNSVQLSERGIKIRLFDIPLLKNVFDIPYEALGDVQLVSRHTLGLYLIWLNTPYRPHVDLKIRSKGLPWRQLLKARHWIVGSIHVDVINRESFVREVRARITARSP